VGAGLVGVFAAEFVAELAGGELTGGLFRATVVGLFEDESGLVASPGGLFRATVVDLFEDESGLVASLGALLIFALSGRFCVAAGRAGAGASPAALSGAG
jgi:hypothetical protein